MATIKIYDLNPIGSELFKDSESFLNELTDNELGNLSKGGWFGFSVTVTVGLTVTVTATVSETYSWPPPVKVY